MFVQLSLTCTPKNPFLPVFMIWKNGTKMSNTWNSEEENTAFMEKSKSKSTLVVRWSNFFE